MAPSGSRGRPDTIFLSAGPQRELRELRDAGQEARTLFSDNIEPANPSCAIKGVAARHGTVVNPGGGLVRAPSARSEK
jgi:hypothetical protein